MEFCRLYPLCTVTCVAGECKRCRPGARAGGCGELYYDRRVRAAQVSGGPAGRQAALTPRNPPHRATRQAADMRGAWLAWWLVVSLAAADRGVARYPAYSLPQPRPTRDTGASQGVPRDLVSGRRHRVSAEHLVRHSGLKTTTSFVGLFFPATDTYYIRFSF